MDPSGHVNESVPLPHRLPITPTGGRGSAQFAETYAKFVSTAAHYEGTAQCKLDQIQVTTLMVHARDDPIVAFSEASWKAAGENKHIIAVSTERGGHCGWAEGVQPFGPAFSDRLVVNYISAVLQVRIERGREGERERGTLRGASSPRLQFVLVCLLTLLVFHHYPTRWHVVPVRIRPPLQLNAQANFMADVTQKMMDVMWEQKVRTREECGEQSMF